MANKKTHEQFEIEMIKKFPDKKYNYLSKYINNSTKIKVQCDKNYEHIWETRPTVLLKGRGCPHCAGNIKWTHEEFVERFIDKYPNKKFIFLSEYKSMHVKIKVQCENGHIWETLPHSLLNKGSGCRKCNSLNPKIRNHENFVKDFQEKYPNKNYIFLNQYIGNSKKLKIQCDKRHIFEMSSNNLYYMNQGCPKCANQQSKAEQEINSIFNNSFIERDKSFDIEIDLVNHNYKLGIEYNGILFHSYGIKFPNNFKKLDKNKHLNKTEILEDNGYQLYHITEDQWDDLIKKEIWISMIKNKLGVSTRIFARKLKIIDLSNKEHKLFVSNFMNQNHLQGNIGYKFAYGLQNQNTGEVYCIMTFGKSRFDKNIQWEIYRFATFKGFTIVGGASKILKHFERNIKPESLISYANRDWSKGNLYIKLGFTFIKNTKPNYWYYDGRCIGNLKKDRIYRQVCQKHKLHKKLENFNENLTELENMINHNFRVYYDTGNLKFVKIYK